MILLVFEGQKEEPKIMATIKTLFFPNREDQILCSFGTDTYTLWNDVQKHISNGYEADVFEIVKERMHSRGDNSLDKYDSHNIDSIYLFFDYDPQNSKISPATLNYAISSIISTFDDPMGNGQIFISYPMVEALFCENCSTSPDILYSKVSLADCRGFKSWSMQFSFSCNRLSLRLNVDNNGNLLEEINDNRLKDLKQKWNELIKQYSTKANLICHNNPTLPVDVSLITQNQIFQHELSDYVNKDETVSLLSSFTLFLFEYFHGNGDF